MPALGSSSTRTGWAAPLSSVWSSPATGASPGPAGNSSGSGLPNAAASSVTASGSAVSASASSSGSDSSTIGLSSSSSSCSASSWWAGTPQYFEPGSAAFGQRLPFESTAAQRPEKSFSSPGSPPPKAASASCWANSVSVTMSIFQPVRRAARRAFIPSLPIASASWSSGTTTVASLPSSSR